VTLAELPLSGSPADLQPFAMRSKSSIMGTYVLALELEARQQLAVGRLGVCEFPAGWYLYVGSARGPGGLAARLARHRRRLGQAKRAHWHVDYVRERAIWGGAWIRPSDLSLECEWAQILGSLGGAERVAPGFGASDCRCAGHLVRVESLPDGEWFASKLGAIRVDVGEG
jgi:Uri superfamily endonuclease